MKRINEDEKMIPVAFAMPRRYLDWLKTLAPVGRSEVVRKSLELMASKKYGVNLLTWKESEKLQ